MVTAEAVVSAEPGLSLTIEESARLVRDWGGAEARLHEVVGGWVPSVVGPAAKIYFDVCSQHHAWRAQLWAERRSGLPAHLAGVEGGAETPVVPPAIGEPAIGEPAIGEPAIGRPAIGRPAIGRPAIGMSAIDRLASVEDDVGRLSAYCRALLPRMVVGYRSWQERCSPVSDQPVARALGFALADVMADWERGSAVLDTYLSGHGAEEAAVSAANASRLVDQMQAREFSLGDSDHRPEQPDPGTEN
jgi:hypothetical protein